MVELIKTKCITLLFIVTEGRLASKLLCFHELIIGYNKGNVETTD